MKALGRRDENWLAQVSARLGVVEAHFARYSQRKVEEISFLHRLKLGRGRSTPRTASSTMPGLCG